MDSEKVISRSLDGVEIDERGVGCVIFEKMYHYRKKIALVEGLTLTEHTYESVLNQSIKVAVNLQKFGIKPNDVILISDCNSVRCTVLFVACLFIGAIPAPVDPSLGQIDFLYLLKQVKPRIAVVTSNTLKYFEHGEGQLDVNIVVFDDIETKDYGLFSNFLKSDPIKEKEFRPVACESVNDTFLMIFSSGTSGRQKAICINHFQLLLQVHILSHSYNTERFISFSSFGWISQVDFALITFYNGGLEFIYPRLVMKEFWKYISDSKPTLLAIATFLVINILNIERPPDSPKTISAVLPIGSLFPKEYRPKCEQVFPEAPAINAYAMTETCGPITLFGIKDPVDVELWKEAPTSVGRVVPGMSIKIVDTNTEELLGPNQEGELRVKSRCLMNGYYNVDSSEAYDPEGWLRTGDLGYYDEKKRFFITGRLKDLIKYCAYKVSPVILEDILLQHPDVVDCVVFGLPHAESDDVPTALIALKDSAKLVNIKDIQQFVDERIHDERQKLRGGIKIVDKIPRSSNGKYLRNVAKDMFLQSNV